MTRIDRPAVIVFDVNETLSDMSTMPARFADVGAPPHLFATWFAGLLRDGFALAAADAAQPFAVIGSGSLRTLLFDTASNPDLDAAVDHIMGGFAELDVHSDVVEGVTALAALGIRLITLSNGSVQVAQTLLDKAGVRENFESLLSVEAAGRWKPHADSYRYALDQCGAKPEDAMLVAVHPWDIDGAHRAGLATAWIHRDGGPYPDYLAAPDVTARSLPHLAQLLGR
ncbi:haloacid dehalogenase type II [Rhodococcus sp. IEGM 1401]|uniref:haloacid dehalogenase type II n=1 Tax=unclassified Rhodococcus (in: high G+C Gram-positive bacteria) TaxID=192944 RepID=UPI0022B558D8|nr:MULTISPECIES: haloacid dehalogenase type II [unclassified Rhodococcus (in: high G+C Gram-positive bacteria)]MCZ4561951.1 haloacid dehalogenase type II [Rhodococcus sp. IEGM 1401]MDI9922725.1 haloacid dehalogenase type II [Rhodococcus sp. IEGM 1372]MDV8034530.1 haloacid dehalogenase type II [Rhodococcus sp. IEGM 1414]